MSDDEQLALQLLLDQVRQLRRKLSDTVRQLPVRAAVTAEIGGQPAHGSALLQRSLDGLPYRSRCAQAVQQQGRASTVAAALVPHHVCAPG
jgi:hypothetical protein